MERVGLEARRRDGAGKSAVKKLRREGKIPAIVYGRGREATPVFVDAKSLRSALHTHAGLNVLIDLAVAGGDRAAQTVMVKEVQRDIFVRDIIHVDFHTIDLTEELEAHVPLTFAGQAKGVVADGGVFEVHLREILVECLPTLIPASIEIDISHLTIGHSIHVRDINLPAEVTMVSQPEEVVATVVMPKVIEEAAPAPAVEVLAAEAVAPEAAQAAEGEPAEKAKAPEAEEKEKKK